jgi:hypothetical protein
VRHHPQAWTLEEHEDGSLDVRRGNRPIATGLHSSGHAESVVRLSRQPGEKVWYVEPDGYRTELTKRFPDPVPRVRAQARSSAVDDTRPIRARYLSRYRRV